MIFNGKTLKNRLPVGQHLLNDHVGERMLLSGSSRLPRGNICLDSFLLLVLPFSSSCCAVTSASVPSRDIQFALKYDC